MGNGKEPLPTINPYDRASIERYAQAAKNALENFDVKKPAYQLDKEFPRDNPYRVTPMGQVPTRGDFKALKALEDIVRDSTQSMERREKALEVIILRGTDYMPYEGLVTWSTGMTGLNVINLEKIAYQQAAKEAVLDQDPALFKKLSQSTDQLPDRTGGRYPATEWMHMMLREGGQLAQDEKRAEIFTPWVVGLPADERGRAVFHLGDAAGAAERTKGMSLAPYLEVQATPVTFGVNYQAGPDSHWNMVTDGTLGKVEDSLGYNNEKGPDPEKAQDRQAFYHGYVLASRGIATPSNPGPDEK